MKNKLQIANEIDGLLTEISKEESFLKMEEYCDKATDLINTYKIDTD